MHSCVKAFHSRALGPSVCLGLRPRRAPSSRDPSTRKFAACGQRGLCRRRSSTHFDLISFAWLSRVAQLTPPSPTPTPQPRSLLPPWGFSPTERRHATRRKRLPTQTCLEKCPRQTKRVENVTGGEAGGTPADCLIIRRCCHVITPRYKREKAAL